MTTVTANNATHVPWRKRTAGSAGTGGNGAEVAADDAERHDDPARNEVEKRAGGDVHEPA